MAKRKKTPELAFQQHIADYLVREHKYGVLEQSDITDTEHFIAEDQLWAFLKASQTRQRNWWMITARMPGRKYSRCCARNWRTRRCGCFSATVSKCVAWSFASSIVAHNHPTGSLDPSPSDVEVTKQLKAAGDVMGITLLDHIIFNRSGYFSFLESGRL